MKKDYIIYKQYGKEDISHGDKLRVDLFNGFKIKDIPELQNFKIKYFTAGYKFYGGCVRYIQIYS